MGFGVTVRWVNGLLSEELRGRQEEAGGGPHPYGGLPAGVQLNELGCCIFEGLGTPDLCTQSRKEPRVPRSPHGTRSCRQVTVA